MSSERDLSHPSLVQSMEYLSVVSSGSIVHNDKNQVSLGQTQTNSTYVHDTSDDTTLEISRDDVILDTSGDNAKANMGVLVSVNGEQNMKTVLSSDANSTVMSSIEGTLISNFTLDGDISWDRDESCLYLSANKAFRFRFHESDGIIPSRLTLEGLNETTLEYMPKVEFHTD